MSKSKNLGFFSTYDAELTHKYYEKCQEENIRLMLMLMRECFIRKLQTFLQSVQLIMIKQVKLRDSFIRQYRINFIMQ